MIDTAFQQMIQAALEDGFSVRSLADGLSVSLPTIRRWKDGTNLPGQALRRAVTIWLFSHGTLRGTVQIGWRSDDRQHSAGIHAVVDTMHTITIQREPRATEARAAVLPRTRGGSSSTPCGAY